MRDEFPATFTIAWGSGRMILYYYSVFPAPKTWLNKLIKKVISLDWYHEKAILTEIAEYLEYNIARTENQKRPLANIAVDAKTDVADMAQQIEYKKRPNGLPLTKDEIKELKEQLKILKSHARETERIFKRNLKDNQGYKDNLILIREKLKDWEDDPT